MKPKRILIYRCGAIGDTIVAIPAVHALRDAFPGATFVLMTAGGGQGVVWTDRVLREFGWFEDFVSYDGRDIRSPRGLWRLIARVRALGIDAVYYLGSEKNSAAKLLRDRLFFLLAGISRFVGTSSDKVNFFGWLRRGPRLYPTEVERMLQNLHDAGIPTGPARFDLPISKAQVERLDAALRESGLDLSRPLVAVCPGSKQKIKVWPEDRFGEIGRRLIAEAGANIVIVGGSDEAVVGQRLIPGWPSGRAINLAQKLSILESAELLRRCTFYLGNDTGAMHIAAAVSTRCVAIFSAREPSRSWHPHGENNVILRKSVSCQNCYLSECVKERLRCLLDISVEEVWAGCQRVMFYR